MHRPACLILLSGLAFAMLVHGPAPRFDAWRVIGPGGAGGMFLPTVSPHDPQLVLQHCDMTGSYISHDSGRSWRMFNLRGTVSAFAFDPRDPKVIYTGSHALFRSEDTGKTWKMIFPDPGRTVEHMRDDHAAPTLTTADPAYQPGPRIGQIAIDPADSSRIYVMWGGKATGRAASSGRLCFSRDRGASWTRVRDFSGDSIALVYFDDGVRVVAGSGVYSLEGREWKRAAGPPGAPLHFAAAGPGLLYATSADGLFLSRDRGHSWQAIKNALPDAPHYAAIACATLHPRTAYVAFDYPKADTLLARFRTWAGIAKTTDGGEHWTPVYQTRQKSAPNVEDAWIEDFYGGTGPIVDLGVAPSNPDVCFATDHCPRAFRTLDGGKTWQQNISEHVADDRWTTTGYDVTTCYGVHFDPFRPQTMYISYTDVGLFKSEDSGQTWKSAIRGIPQIWRNTTYWVEFDPQVKGLMWGGFARTHDLPRPKMWQRRTVEEFAGGTGISTDGGEHWTVTNTGMPETPVTHIVMDPASPVGARTLYACGFGRGVYKSVDNGKSWALKIEGIEKHQPFAWRITRAQDGTLYLVVSRRSERAGADPAEDGALYKSTDGAEHWVRMKLPAGSNGPTGLALDPGDNRRMYLSAWGAFGQEGNVGGGVLLSTDGGATWRNIFDKVQHVYDVTVDPRDPGILYNCGFENGAWRSTDRGATWTRIRGFNFKWGHRVIPDPVDPAKIYVTTFGGSVWHGPAAGDPRAVEDLVSAVKVER
jgi:photosystem II stability/assembly factor-like uncharacterized protein